MSAAVKMGGPAASATGADNQFLAVIIDEVTREAVKAAAGQLGWRNPKVREGGAEAALALLKTAPAPAFLLVDISDADDPVLAVTALAELCEADTRVVAIGMLNDVGVYRRLIEMGVRDYLVKPVSSQALATAIQAATEAGPREADRVKTARIIGMIGARGGVGTTTLALSTAWTISQQQQKVVLLDLDLHFGSLALSLDLDPGRGLREILTNPDRIDSLLISAAMTGANDRLRILGAEEPLEDALDIGHDGLSALVADLATGADVIVVDLPRSLGHMTRHILGIADVITVVTDQSLPAMRDTQRLLSLVRSLRPEMKIVVAANRVGGVAGEVGRADFERGIGGKIGFAVPYDAKAAAAAAEHAKPFVDVARNPKTVAEVRCLALALAGAESTPAPTPSLLKRMLGK